MKNHQVLSAEEIRVFNAPLLNWYKKNKRNLPWRGVPSAYAVWVSEVMLQQTRVEVVRDYFSRWLQKLPTLQSLAESSEDDVLHLWQGLGYYSRARRLRQGAKYVVEHFGGELPQDPTELLKVPGIGPYTAGAVSSIAFNQRAAVVDGNVIRVLTRYFALGGDPTSSLLAKKLWALAGELVPARSPGDFNQALMELGATVCTPRSPLCHSCPVRQNCKGLSQGTPTKYPELKQRAKPTERTFVVLLLRKQGKYAVVRLPADATWWAGLDGFPFEECDADDVEKVAHRLARQVYPVEVRRIATLSPIRHTVTRYKLTFIPVVCEASGVHRSDSEVRWRTRKQFSELALPSVFGKVVRALEATGR